MSGKNAATPRTHKGIKGKRPDGKAMRVREAAERAAAHEAEGSPRSKKKRLAALKEAADKK